MTEEITEEVEVEVSKMPVSVKVLKEKANEMRGVMAKGNTLIGSEVLDLDMGLKWTKKLLKLINEEYILPDSLKRINFFKIDEDDDQQITGKFNLG